LEQSLSGFDLIAVLDEYLRNLPIDPGLQHDVAGGLDCADRIESQRHCLFFYQRRNYRDRRRAFGVSASEAFCATAQRDG
jgi:hypothetical protein